MHKLLTFMYYFFFSTHNNFEVKVEKNIIKLKHAKGVQN